MASVCIRQRGAAHNDSARCHHSGCSGYLTRSPVTETGPRREAAQKNGLQGPRMARRARNGGDRKRSNNVHTRKQVITFTPDAECDELVANRIEFLARVVVLAAKMTIR